MKKIEYLKSIIDGIDKVDKDMFPKSADLESLKDRTFLLIEKLPENKKKYAEKLEQIKFERIWEKVPTDLGVPLSTIKYSGLNKFKNLIQLIIDDLLLDNKEFDFSKN